MALGSQGVAIVGMSCRYPDASSPDELWANVVGQRRAFRRIPPERLPLDDYGSASREDIDLIYCSRAAVLEGFEFDRIAFKVSADQYREVDVAHWIALDVAASAIADAGFGRERLLPGDTTGVIVGNSLTGDWSRAVALRLRWPYVRRLLDRNADRNRPVDWLARLEAAFKAPFTPVGSESLAGALSNTIAGRICNHFNLHGGGYTVDAACASSLLSVITACSSLIAGDIDVGIAGGVDISLDPFELVGFSRLGALADGEMRVYDERAQGFWPGEGCGFVVLVRLADALALGLRPYAVIRGWGISSDGDGGITRPEVAGQRLALQRAYRRAGYGIETVPYFEGHGTGTPVGDRVEVQALLNLRDQAPAAIPAAIGSIKANIGHTKAAAGIAGLIKASLTVQRQLLPPTTGCETPLAELRNGHGLSNLEEPGEWPEDAPLRAGVSAMGFGGINSHVAIESPLHETARSKSTWCLLPSMPGLDVQIYAFAADSYAVLDEQVELLASHAAKLSLAEMGDAAAAVVTNVGAGRIRAAVVAATPEELAARLGNLRHGIAARDAVGRLESNVYLGVKDSRPRVGYLFTGQGAPASVGGGLMRRGFEVAAAVYQQAHLPKTEGSVDTRVVQPAVVTASVAALRVLEALGVNAEMAVGHSLGELTALYWAGSLRWPEVLELARVRAHAMSAEGTPPGAMVSISADVTEVQPLLVPGAVIGCINSRRQTVVSGEAAAVAEVGAACRRAGWNAQPLAVSHAFHSPLMRPAAAALEAYFRATPPLVPARQVASTVTGQLLTEATDVAMLLCRQPTEPVDFVSALEAMRGQVDLLIELGPGTVLADLAQHQLDLPAFATDVGGRSVRGLLEFLAAAFTMGLDIRLDRLYAGRAIKQFNPARLRFLVSPCECDELVPTKQAPVSEPLPLEVPAAEIERASLEVLRELVSRRTELPLEAIRENHRFLSDLHLNSIRVSSLMLEAVRLIGAQPPRELLDFADASLAEAAEALSRLPTVTNVDDTDPPGLTEWVRLLGVRMTPAQPRTSSGPAAAPEGWSILGATKHQLAEALRANAADLPGSGAFVLIDGDLSAVTHQLLQAVQADVPNLVFVQISPNRGAGGFVRSLYLERPDINVRLVNVLAEDPNAASYVVSEVPPGPGFEEIVYDQSGRRWRPALFALAGIRTEAALCASDVLFVTGGGKGIGAECALDLNKWTGCKLALVGRSSLQDDDELAANLARFAEAHAEFVYVRADVSDAAQAARAVAEAQDRLGPITAILHAAGSNRPTPLRTLDSTHFQDAIGAKCDGLQHLLASVDPRHLRLLIAFGSVIARSGLQGEAHYAFANEWLRVLVERYAAENASCRCHCLEWSVWSGAGMAERLDTTQGLRNLGVTPITIEQGLASLRHVLSLQGAPVAIVISGRLGRLPTVTFDEAELPFWRFLEEPRVHYPAIELVADCELTAASDPYLEDHIFQGEAIVPAAAALEAMSEAVVALTSTDDSLTFEDVKFNRPITVSADGSRAMRLVAAITQPGEVDVALRSDATAYQVDHFRARCRTGQSAPPSTVELPTIDLQRSVELDPKRDLYGSLLFQSGRFRRLERYSVLSAFDCVAHLAPADGKAWFAQHLPSQLVAGDIGIRDASLHCLQACIPTAVVLPAGAETIYVRRGELPSGLVSVRAAERESNGDWFTWDLDIVAADGSLIEAWRGLRLHKVEDRALTQEWPTPLLSIALERYVRDICPEPVKIKLAAAAESSQSSEAALAAVAGQAVRRRPDGKPVVSHGHLSSSHAAGLDLVIAAARAVGCDLEWVTSRTPENWADLLGAEGKRLAERIAIEREEPLDVAATRVWSAFESLKKIGSPAGSALLGQHKCKNVVLLTSGRVSVETIVIPPAGDGRPLVAAIAIGSGDAHV